MVVQLALRAQYSVARAPTRLVQSYLTRRLAEDHPARLLMERTLGSVDLLMGWAADDAGTCLRGQDLLDHVEAVRQTRAAEARRQEAAAAVDRRVEWLVPRTSEA